MGIGMHPSLLSATARQTIKASLPRYRVADYVVKFYQVDHLTGVLEVSSPVGVEVSEAEKAKRKQVDTLLIIQSLDQAIEAFVSRGILAKFPDFICYEFQTLGLSVEGVKNMLFRIGKEVVGGNEFLNFVSPDYQRGRCGADLVYKSSTADVTNRVATKTVGGLFCELVIGSNQH